MSDMGYFGLLAFALTCVIASWSIIKQRHVAQGAIITLSTASCLGFVSTLPFANTRELPWLPVVAAATFLSLILGTILCFVCQLRR